MSALAQRTGSKVNRIGLTGPTLSSATEVLSASPVPADLSGATEAAVDSEFSVMAAQVALEVIRLVAARSTSVHILPHRCIN